MDINVTVVPGIWSFSRGMMEQLEKYLLVFSHEPPGASIIRHWGPENK